MSRLSYRNFPQFLLESLQRNYSLCKRWSQTTFLVSTILFISCSQPLPKDPCCDFLEITKGIPMEDGQGLLQVDGSTAASYYVEDDKGEQIDYQLLNKPLALDPGTYTVKVNNSTHVVHIQPGKLARCSTGTLMVSGSTSENYSVMDSAGVQLGYETLGKAMSFFPCNVKIRVNDTELSATVKLKELTEIRTGSVVVTGTTGEQYYVLDKGNKQLNYNTIGKPLAFLPGSYVVTVNNTSRKAEVMAGASTQLPTGNLIVRGLTEEYYYVTDTAGNALNYQTLNKPLAFFPGGVQVKVNNTVVEAAVVAGQTSEFVTGSLILTGGGNAYYYVLDQLGNQLNFNSLNKSLSFFPSEYTIRLGSSTRKATVIGGQLTSISAFN